MHCSLHLLSVFSIVLAVPAASAQLADTQGATGGAQATVVQLGQRRSATSVPGIGSSKALLVSHGAYITGYGNGAGGADTSAIEPGFTTFGYSMQGGTVDNHLADDFTVPSLETWDIADYRWITYQTGGSTAGTLTGVHLGLWNSLPTTGGSAWMTGPANSLVAQEWTGVYRVTTGTLTLANRPLIEVKSSAAWTPILASGTYWLDATLTGSIASGPWGPPRTPALATDNARQFTGALGTWGPVIDAMSSLPQDALFAINGISASTCVSTYCTSKPSSLGGCVPSVHHTGAPDCAAGDGFVLLCGPVPGGPPGLFFYSTGGPALPSVTPFGSLCVTPPLTRVALSPAVAGGTAGSCDGTYYLDFNRYFATTSLTCGTQIDGQFWYRDTGFAPPGNANFSEAVQFVMVAGSCLALSSPSISGFSPGSGAEGTILNISGSGFGSAPGDLKVLLANGIGFADVLSATDTQIVAKVFKVGPTGSGPMHVIRGFGTSLPGHTISSGGISSTSQFVHMVSQGTAAASGGAFTLSPSSNNTVGSSFGVPNPATVDVSTVTGDKMTYRMSFEVGAECYSFEGRIDFTAVPTSTQRASHFAQQLNRSFSGQGIFASSSGTVVQVSMAGATYGGIVLAPV
jgi:hypothetical protein